MIKRIFIASVASILVACGGGGDGSSDLTGTWTGVSTAVVNGEKVTGSGVWRVSQTGNTFTGIAIGDNGATGTIEGTVNGNTVTGMGYPSNPDICSSQFVLNYSNNTLTGQAVTVDCTVFLAVDIVLKR